MSLTVATPSRPSVGHEGVSRRWLMLGVLAVLQFMLVLDATVVNIALPSIKADLGFSPANLTWVVDAYVLVAGGFLLLGGRAADLFGRRRIFVAGALAFAVGSLASGLAQDQVMLIGSRAFQGLGEALAGPAALSIIAVSFTDAKERATALSIWGGLAGLGGTLGVLLSGAIVDLASWRWIFWINLPVAAAVVSLTPSLVPRDRHRARHGFDLVGALSATGGVTSLVYALVEANRHGWTSVTTLGFFGTGAALVAAFVAIESRRGAPLVPLSYFRARRPRAAAGLMVLLASALYGMFFLLTLYMQLVLGWTPLRSGVAYVAFGLAMLVGISVASQVVPKAGVRPMLGTGMALGAGGLALFTRLPMHLSYWTQMVPGMVLVAVGLGLALVAVTMAAVSDAGEADAGLASGMVTTAQQVGGALGLAVLVSIATSRASSLVGSGQLPGVAQLAGSHLAFGIGAGLLALGAVLAVVLLRRGEPTAMTTPTLITEVTEEGELEALAS